MTGALNLSQASGQSALAIAAFMSRPLTAMRPQAVDRWLSDVNGRDVRPMLDVPDARRVVETYIADKSGANQLAIEVSFLNSLAARASVVTAVEIALAPFSKLDRLKGFIIGAICRDTIRGTLLKSDRQAVAALLGPDVMDFAARQAAVFYPALGGLAASIGPALRSSDGTPFADHPVSALAGHVVLAAIGAEAEIAATILSIREAGASEYRTPVPLSQQQRAEVLRLWQREAR